MIFVGRAQIREIQHLGAAVACQPACDGLVWDISFALAAVEQCVIRAFSEKPGLVDPSELAQLAVFFTTEDDRGNGAVGQGGFLFG